MKILLALCAIAGYVGTVVAANWLTAEYGLVPVGFGLLATAGTYAAGLAFVLRDAVQDTAGRLAVLGALLVGAGLSWWLANPALAVASAAAFGLSELADMAIYIPLRKRGYVRAAVASNVVGSVVDTVVFLWLAGFGLAPLVIAGQLVGKVTVTAVVVGLVVVVRALLRHRVRAEGV
jgi:queuosine precursor transporter